MRTAKDVQLDVINLIKESALFSVINGNVYRNGYRPRDSKEEDIIVTFTTGNSGDIEEGVITINIYVPDIDPFLNGVFVENGARCDIMEQLASEWVDSLSLAKTPYNFNLKQTIYTEAEEEINQHFIVVRLDYRIINNNL